MTLLSAFCVQPEPVVRTKARFLVEHVVHAHADFAPLTAEYLLAQVEVAEQEFVVVIVRESDVLRVGGVAVKVKPFQNTSFSDAEAVWLK